MCILDSKSGVILQDWTVAPPTSLVCYYYDSKVLSRTEETIANKYLTEIFELEHNTS